MPYAQQHYPFENKHVFENGFPADFIAEGIDQTRGWFYTLMVLSTALFDKPPFMNLIANGLVLAEDGKKMSKRLKNYPNPSIVVESYGADALRLYLINSPVVRAETLKFKESDVKSVVREVMLPWYNASCFFIQEIRRWEMERGTSFEPAQGAAGEGCSSPMDSWLQAALQGLVSYVHTEMKAYRLYTVVPRLVEFIQDLCNWYVRLNRPRLKGRDGWKEAHAALSCMFEVLLTSSILMAPLTPFFSEFLYQRLLPIVKRSADPCNPEAPGTAQSVHHIMLPHSDPSRLNPLAVANMQVMKEVIELGRTARERKAITLKTPIKELFIISSNTSKLDAVKKLEGYVKTELNTYKVTYVDDEEKWMSYSALPNLPKIAKRLGKRLKAVREGIVALSDGEIREYTASGSITVCGEVLGKGELLVTRSFEGNASVFEAEVSSESQLMVVLDITRDAKIERERIAREVINRIQKLRKKAGLIVGDRVEVFFSVKVMQQQERLSTSSSKVPSREEAYQEEEITEAVEDNLAMIREITGSTPLPKSFAIPDAVIIDCAESQLGGAILTLSLTVPRVWVGQAFEEQAKSKGVDIGASSRLLGGFSPARLRDLSGGQNGGGGSGTVLHIRLNGVQLEAKEGRDFFLSCADKFNTEREDR